MVVAIPKFESGIDAGGQQSEQDSQRTEAEAKVSMLVREAKLSLQSGDIKSAVEALDSAGEFKGARAYLKAKKLREEIHSAVDPTSVIYVLAKLPEDDFEAYLSGRVVDSHNDFTYQVLRDSFAGIAGASMEAVATRRVEIAKREKQRLDKIELVRAERSSAGAAFAIDPKQLVEGLSSLGLSVDIPWRQSRLDSSYLAILTQPFGANEISCLLESDQSRYVSTVTVEAEFYAVGQFESEMLDHFVGVVGVLYPAAPESLLKAIVAKTSWSSQSWTLALKPHSRNGGFDLQLVGTVEEPAKAR